MFLLIFYKNEENLNKILLARDQINQAEDHKFDD